MSGSELTSLPESLAEQWRVVLREGVPLWGALRAKVKASSFSRTTSTPLKLTSDRDPAWVLRDAREESVLSGLLAWRARLLSSGARALASAQG